MDPVNHLELRVAELERRIADLTTTAQTRHLRPLKEA